MKKGRYIPVIQLLVVSLFLILVSCASVPIKKYYVINYEPEPIGNRKHDAPYPFVIRVKDMDIEEAYNRSQIVYRKSPFELQYYFYRVWAVKPEIMLTDLIHKHMVSTGLVSHVVRRFDEGARPDYELTGRIEAIEEYDSEDVWFAHLAFRLNLVRLKDNHTVYTRRFDSRKQVFQREPEYVVRELSRIMDILMTQAIHDIDGVLAKEHGVN
ncbi:MAG: ABC-type transport auxiliary lipoprotein family protein [Chitinivibrionales bacterium]